MLLPSRTPISLGSPLQYFFSRAKINIRHEDKIINLMDYFPMLKQGLTQRLTLDVMIQTYIDVNNLRDHSKNRIGVNGMLEYKLDDLFIKAFDSDIPAYKQRLFNTFKLLESRERGFDRENVNGHDIRDIKDFNSCNITLSITDMSKIRAECQYAKDLDFIIGSISDSLRNQALISYQRGWFPSTSIMSQINVNDMISLGKFTICDAIMSSSNRSSL